MANQIGDEVTSAVAADQSESSDDVASETLDVATATPSAPPPTPANVDDGEVPDVIESSEPADMIIDDNGAIITPEEMNLAQLKVRVACLEKANMALRMELKCAELQVNVPQILHLTQIY